MRFKQAHYLLTIFLACSGCTDRFEREDADAILAGYREENKLIVEFPYMVFTKTSGESSGRTTIRYLYWVKINDEKKAVEIGPEGVVGVEGLTGEDAEWQ